jgi:hypothetical protein
VGGSVVWKGADVRGGGIGDMREVKLDMDDV